MRTVFIWVICHFVAAAIIPAVWLGVRTGYPHDSFWTLSQPGQIGVITISISGLLVLAAISAWKTREILKWSRHRWRLPIWILDVCVSLALLAVIFSISPQVYYSFYQQIIAGLPNQWVIDGPLNWARLQEVAIPRTDGSIADHGAAIAMGGLILFTAYLHRR